MATMMSAPANRSPLGVDDPWNDDGFYRLRTFKGGRKGGKATGGRGWRRTVRAKENARFRREVRREDY